MTEAAPNRDPKPESRLRSPARILLGIAGCGLLLGLTDAAPLAGQAPDCPGVGVEVPILSVARGVVGELKERGTAVVRTQSEWRAMWARLGLPLKPAPSVPVVDFSKQFVVGVFAGEKKGTLEVEVTRIERKEGCLLVTVSERKVPGNLPAGQFDHFRPFHFVRLPAVNQRIVFRYTSTTR